MSIDEAMALLGEARRLLAERDHQERYFAAIPDPITPMQWKGGAYEMRYKEQRLLSVSPLTEGAQLSWRGAIILAAGSGPATWPLYALLNEYGLVPCYDPVDKQAALGVLDHLQHELRYAHKRKRNTKIPLAPPELVG